MKIKNLHATWFPSDATADVTIPPGETVDVGAKTFAEWSPIARGLKAGYLVEVTEPAADPAPRGRRTPSES